MTKRRACLPAPGSLEAYAQQFDACFAKLAQRQALRAYLQGLLLPRERNKTLTGLAGRTLSAVRRHHPRSACSGSWRSRAGT